MDLGSPQLPCAVLFVLGRLAVLPQPVPQTLNTSCSTVGFRLQTGPNCLPLSCLTNKPPTPSQMTAAPPNHYSGAVIAQLLANRPEAIAYLAKQ